MLGNSKNISPGGHLQLPIQVQGVERLPVRAKLKPTLKRKKDGALLIPAGANVLVRLKEQLGDVFSYEVTEYTKKRNFKLTQPETWAGELDVGESYVIKTDRPQTYFEFNRQHYLRHAAVLFPQPNSPNISEVSQGALPDCFLLAAIQSILNHPNGPAFIRGMFYQHDDGRVSVKLFNPRVKLFEYITVENALIVGPKGALNHHLASWVHVLESAYAVMEARCENKKNSAVSAVFSGGGYSEYAATVLTGLIGESHLTPFNLCDFSNYIDKEMLSKIRETFEEISVIADDHEEERSITFIEECFPHDKDLIVNFFAPDTETEAQLKFFRLIKFYSDNKKRYDKAIMKKGLSAFSEDESSIVEILSPILHTKTRKSAFPLAGYGKDELDVFNLIYDALENGKIVMASSQASQGFIGDLQSANAGVITGHAYSVLNVSEEKVKRPDPNGNKVTVDAKFIHLRNPWGRMGRVYLQHKVSGNIIAKSSESADTFKVELNDFCHYYSRIRCNASANALFHFDALKEQLNQQIIATVDSWDVDSDSSIGRLKQARKAYPPCEDELFKLALLELTLLDDAFGLALTGVMDQAFDDESQRKKVFAMTVSSQYVEMDESEDLHPFYWIAGDKAAVTERLYQLFCYQSLMAQQAPNEPALALLRTQIIASSLKPEGWDVLLQQRVMCNAIIDARREAYLQHVDDFEAQYASLKSYVEALDSCMGDDIEVQMTKIVINQAMLEVALTRLLASQARYVALDESATPKNISDIHALLNAIDELDGINDHRLIHKQTIIDIFRQGTELSVDGKLAPSACSQLEALSEGFSLTVEDSQESEQLSDVLTRYQKKSGILSFLFKAKDEQKMDNNNNYQQNKPKGLAFTLKALLLSLTSYITSVLNLIGDSGMI